MASGQNVWFSLTDASLTSLSDAQFVGLKNYLSWITLSSGRTIYRGCLPTPLGGRGVEHAEVHAGFPFPSKPCWA